jgi:hypothetical protein
MHFPGLRAEKFAGVCQSVGAVFASLFAKVCGRHHVSVRPDLISVVCVSSFSSSSTFIFFSFFFVSSAAAWRRSPPSA